jgi:hypothetical protein
MRALKLFLEHAERDNLTERLARHVVFALKNKKKHCFDLTKQQNDARAAPRAEKVDLRVPRSKYREPAQSDAAAASQGTYQGTQRVCPQKEAKTGRQGQQFGEATAETTQSSAGKEAKTETQGAVTPA